MINKDEYIKVLERLLAERDRVLEAIPECPVHGHQCIPHALEWIQKQLSYNTGNQIIKFS